MKMTAYHLVPQVLMKIMEDALVVELLALNVQVVLMDIACHALQVVGIDYNILEAILVFIVVHQVKLLCKMFARIVNIHV